MNHISKTEGSTEAYCGGWANPTETRDGQADWASCQECIAAYFRDPTRRDDGVIQREGTVGEVIDGRRGVYGDPKVMFSRTAEIWSGITGHHISATDVPLMLIGYKALRAQHTPDYSDNSDDIEGYLDIFREIVGEDMVHARSVTEYLEKRGE